MLLITTRFELKYNIFIEIDTLDIIPVINLCYIINDKNMTVLIETCCHVLEQVKLKQLIKIPTLLSESVPSLHSTPVLGNEHLLMSVGQSNECL